MTTLLAILDTFRQASKTEREKGIYFENLAKLYFTHEPRFADLYSHVWLWEEWRKVWIEAGNADPGGDTGIDLVAKTQGTGEHHAIQAKFYDSDSTIYKKQVDSFFTASGKKPFTHRLLILSTDKISPHVDTAIQGQHTPCQKITLADLEQSVIDWAEYYKEKVVKQKPKKGLRNYQQAAVDQAIEGLKTADRGKLIMACGTGKTFTSLRLAEQVAGAGGRVLFLVPSLSLLSQTLTEWTQESATPMHSFAVCSDSDVGKRRDGDDDFQMLVHELQYPATTNAKSLAAEITKRHDAEHMSVVFSTYHSVDVISQAQKLHGLPDFDLIVCDEAHRTTGASFADADESAFVKVHDQAVIKGKKRVYMTATPRIWSDTAKVSAGKDNVALYSMDDENIYGKELYLITFSEAVRRGLLVDYKVIVLSIEESHVNRRLQKLLAAAENQLKVDDAARIVGCWKALSKQGMSDDLVNEHEAMRRAVAFCQVIEVQKGSKTHKVSSKQIKAMFQTVVEAYQESAGADDEELASTLVCEAEHIDGGMNASQKEAKLTWLKAKTPENTCRVLSNVRCLSEGVDVPALDAVIFLTPRSSQVDVVQSVGRVMRNAPGKKRGYVILPVVVPAGVEPHDALNDNKTYAVVWQVLQALRSHDDRFDAMVNKLDLIGKDPSKMEVIAITDKVAKKTPKDKHAAKGGNGKGSFNLGTKITKKPGQEQIDIPFEIGEIERAIYAKLVQKVGNRHHWEDWANDIAKIARTHIDRITGIVENEVNTAERAAFFSFANELRDDLNNSITDAEVIEMLAQHLITKPVFDALFADYSFAQHNPMSLAMQGVLEVLQEHRLDKEADTLQRFYDSVKLRAEGIDSAQGKQKIVVELYDKFFRNAFPKMTERLGIVYTPVEVVDFIIHSVAHILETEFGQTLGSEGVHIIDPFTGTGTFITRLLQSGLIAPEQLPHKYKHEIHANEIVLLAYYIAAINIEAVYHSTVGGRYVPFEGICLTDTFQMYEKDDLVDAMLVDNSARRKRQKKLDIRVIMGNPPYSVGQENANDNNQNVAYPHLDERIRRTYAERSSATNKNALYDSYIRGIRWASDRIGDSGVIGFVTNANFLETGTFGGLRQCLADEFASIYVFHLRGNQRTSGEQSRREGGKIFGSGSRAPIAISLLVKNPKAQQQGQIHFFDIGDYLSREEKLGKIQALVSIAGIGADQAWQRITPDQHGDWLRQRDESFTQFIVLGDKDDKDTVKLFDSYSAGVKSQRDAWCWNASRLELAANMTKTILAFNSESARFEQAFPKADRRALEERVDSFVTDDPGLISWTRALKQDVVRRRKFAFDAGCLTSAIYRPYTKQWLYFNRRFNEMVYRMPSIFPDADARNLVICMNAVGAQKEFSVLMSDHLPDLHLMQTGQCFPLYLYEDTAPKPDAVEEGANGALFETGTEPVQPANRIRRDALTDAGLAHFQTAYPGEAITKEDVFYYVYGLLHSPGYRERYADNLSKELPRIPCVKKAADFWGFSKAGRDLADLHIGYEAVKPYPLTIEGGGLLLTNDDFRVEKMRYGKKGKDKDLSTLHYNTKITVTGIPLEAYDYVVNGKPALDWVVERQCVKTDKDSGIVNDANDWAVETMGNPRYPLELFQRVITVSLETMKIVRALPKLDV
ncbi:MAG: type ISP restriction/modification enzyme [Pseudomonadota bacterium]